MTFTSAADYRVQLDIFTGPLDLLYYLVRRNEVEIVDLPIAQITHQFLELLEVLEVLDLDSIGEFIVVASTLIEIKSRQVLPEEQVDEIAQLVDTSSDPRAELVQQLLEYKRFKDAAKLLEEQSAEWQQRYPRLPDGRPLTGGNPAEDLIKEVELWDLVSALSRVLRANSPQAPRKIIYDDTPISVYIDRIRTRVLAEGRVTFSSFFVGSHIRSKIVGIFLAILELLRHYKFRAEQPDPYGEIWVMPPLPTPIPELHADRTTDETESAVVEPSMKVNLATDETQMKHG